MAPGGILMTIPTIFSLLIIFLFSFSWINNRILKIRNKKKKAAPEPRGAWPLLGHLHLLAGPEPAHMVLGNIADEYGPIFTIKMGSHRALVVSSSEMAKECFTTHDKAFASRPKSLAAEILGYDSAMFGFSSYGPYWRQLRKLATLELLSNYRVEMLRDVREAQVRASVKELYKVWENSKGSENRVLVEMKKWVKDISLNVILKIIVGKSVEIMSSDEKKAWREFFDLVGENVVGDFVPFLRWLDIGGHERAMKKIAKKLDTVIDGWLKEHKQKKRAGKQDFMDIMLGIIDEDAEVSLGRNSDTINKATCLSLALAGSDSTTTTLTWILSLLVNNPHVLNKAQQELETYVGRERFVNESDLNNLVYLKAIIKETMRLYPAGPLSMPHQSIQDISIAGYHIPAGTILFVNLWKIHRDPQVWSNPSEFQPERFLTTHKEIDVRGQSFELMPFGSGRRMCPAVSFALQAVQLTLATLLHGFDFATPSGEPVHMTESNGLSNFRATPLELLINPRLQSDLYCSLN